MGMAPNPIIFALANPDPEIAYDVALAARPDAIVATGRSDYPEPGEQRPRLPVHLPRRAGRPRHHHQRRDEAGRHARAGRARQGGRARFRAARLRRRPPGVRPRVHHSQAVRSARADLGGVRRGAGRHGDRRGADARGPQAVPRGAGTAAGQGQRSHARHDQQGARSSPSASSSPRARKARSCAPARSCSTRRSPSRSCSATKQKIRAKIAELRLHLNGIQIVDPATFPRLDEYTEEFYSLRQRKGITRTEAEQLDPQSRRPSAA